MLCFFFNDTATTEIYTLSLHDALPIFWGVAKTLIPAPLRSMTAVDRPTCATVPRRKLIKAWLLVHAGFLGEENRLSEHIYEYPSKGPGQSARTPRLRFGLGPGALRRRERRTSRTGGGN